MTRISTRHLDRLSIILNYVRQDMTFEEYIEIIKGSVAETGYDNFRPSLCIPGEQIKMDVFDTSLSQAGEEILAAKGCYSPTGLPTTGCCSLYKYLVD